MAGVPARIRNEHLPNISQKHYRCSIPFGLSLLFPILSLVGFVLYINTIMIFTILDVKCVQLQVVYALKFAIQITRL
jgi:hypothetical protein